MRIAWGGSLRSTPLNFRRRGDGAQRGGTENIVVNRSSVAVRFKFGRVPLLQAVVRPRSGAPVQADFGEIPQPPRGLIPENEGTGEGKISRL